MKKFRDFNLSEVTQRFIDLNHFTEPTPIQSEVIKKALKGKDIIAISKTGTGKTHAFLIPLMEKIDVDLPEVQAVITAPTRELAMQLYTNAKLMMQANEKLQIKLITGGIEKAKMADSLKSNQPHIVIGTPGRIKDLFLNETVLRVDKAKTLIIDEADMTLEYGFLDDIDQICSRMTKNLQMMAFSATMPNGLVLFLKKYMSEPYRIHIKEAHHSNPNIDHVLVPCKHLSFAEMLLKILPGFVPYVCLIFANTRVEAAEVAKQMREKGYDIIEIHGGLSSRQRKFAMKQLQANTKSFIVASDIASRGLDIDGVTHVVSLGFPSEPDFYIHRAGRCGRHGKHGICYALYHEEDTRIINYFKERGIKFFHRSFKGGQWIDLKPFGVKKIAKNDLREKEIAKTLHRKKDKVKPGYKKKKAALVQKIKRKERRDQIRQSIKEQRKERYKQEQRLKNKGLLD